MAKLFSMILNMSLTGSIVILLVLAARLLMKRFPKIYSYALWAAVLFRLLCPVSLSAAVSPLTPLQPQVTPASTAASTVSYLPYTGEAAQNIPVSTAETGAATQQPTRSSPSLLQIGAVVWITGASTMGLYSLLQYFRLRRRLADAAPYRGDVYLSDRIDMPFVLGIIRPRAYLPSGISGEERRFIIRHERHHIRRGDPIWKLLGYIALCLHWFNPLVWIAFALAGKDMEMSCDEAVIQMFPGDIRADYSAALLRVSSGRKMLSGMALAFGEGETGSRIRNMAGWKKPAPILRVICAVLCAMVLAACAVNPAATGKAGKSRIPCTIGQLPEGFAWNTEEDGSIRFTRNGKTVGGIVTYPIPDGVYDPNDRWFFWLERVGIADYSNPALCYSGGTNYDGIGWYAEFTSDVPPGTPQTILHCHTFYASETTVYDFWLDGLLADENERFFLFRTVTMDLPRPAQSPQDSPANADSLFNEEEAFARCGAVMESAKRGCCQIVSVVKNDCERGPENSATFFAQSGVRMLSIRKAADGDRILGAYMQLENGFFSNAAHPGELVWERDQGDVPLPWMVSFFWNRNIVSYTDTISDRGQTCDMFRIAAPFSDEAGLMPVYFVNFYFDEAGHFGHCVIDITYETGDTCFISESFESMNADFINQAIDEEAQKIDG